MIITLTGANTFALHEELAARIHAFVAEHTDMALERLDGEDASYDRMRAAVESAPFLTARKLVVLRAPSAQKEFTEQIDDFFQAVSDTTDVLIVEPKLDKRQTYYKRLVAGTQFQSFDAIDEAALVNWAVQYATKLGAQISTTDARYLVGRIGLHQQQLAQELAKLSLYSHSITRRTIDLLVEQTLQSTVFDLMEAAFAGNVSRAMQLYDEQRKAKVEPQAIMGLVGWQLHILALLKTAGGRDATAIARDARINPFVVRKSSNVARTMSVARLRDLVTDAARLDVRLKSESIDTDDAVRAFLLSLAKV